MDYHRVYCQLLLSARSKSRKSLAKSDPDYVYYEEHHILPRSMGGADHPQNLVLLTPREHFIAHWLLPKFTAGQDYYKMLHALGAMPMGKDKRKLTSRQYAVCAEAKSVAMAECQSSLGAKGLHRSQAGDWKEVHANRSEKFCARQKERNAKISAENGHNFQSDEFRAYKSDFQRQIVHCHCGKTGQRAGMAKAHGKNCKVKPQLALALQLAGLQSGNWLNVSNDTATLKAKVRKLEAEEHARTLLERQLKAKQSKSERAKIKATCPWCGKTGNKPPMRAHHFDNCSLHPANAGLTREQIRAKSNRTQQVMT